MSDAGAIRQNIADTLRRTAARLPHKLAIQCGETSWSYLQFDQLCNRLANGLMSRNLAVGDRVAVLARNSHSFAALRFAVARCGALLVPINFMLNADECVYILKHCGARLLFLDSSTLDQGLAAAKRSPELSQVFWMPGEHQPSRIPPAGMASFQELVHVNANEPKVLLPTPALAQIVYTSGTESLPKGAMLTHEALLTQYVSCLLDAEIAEEDRLLHAMPLYHCAQLDVFLGPAIYAGASNIIVSQALPEILLPLLAAHNISAFFAPPTVWISLLRSALFETTNLTALKKGYYGASIMPVEVLTEIQRRLPTLRLWNLYGQTEIAPLAAVLKPADQVRKAGTAGRPVINVETRVVDDHGASVAPGEIGEIVHRSPQLMLGYYNSPEQTAAAFRDGWFHSGDLATQDSEGYLTVVDRKKDMIKTGGENVSSREVEDCIYKLPAVSEVAVIGLPDPRWIESVTAVVVLRAGRQLDESGLIEHCRKQLASFKAPKRVIFVQQLPRNPSGKLLKRELRLQFGNAV